jgi:hypothetical protein
LCPNYSFFQACVSLAFSSFSCHLYLKFTQWFINCLSRSLCLHSFKSLIFIFYFLNSNHYNLIPKFILKSFKNTLGKHSTHKTLIKMIILVLIIILNLQMIWLPEGPS